MPPKVHLLVDHLAYTMQHCNRIGDFDISFVERNHQFGKTLGICAWNMQDVAKKPSAVHIGKRLLHRVLSKFKTVTIDSKRTG